MKYCIKHQTDGQIHIILPYRRLTDTKADVLYYGLLETQDVISVHVFQRTAAAVIRHKKGATDKVLQRLATMDLHSQEAIDALPGVSARATNEEFKDKAATKILVRLAKRTLLPFPLRAVWTVCNGAPYIREGLKDLFQRNFSAEIVHASAILAS